MSQEHRSQVTGSHPADIMLADYLDDLLSADKRAGIEAHLANCDECLKKAVSAYESVKLFKRDVSRQKRKERSMGKINFYFIFAVMAFALSFIVPRFFLQLLVATLLLGAKWIVDSRSTKMLVMIHEAWKNGGGEEASKVIKRLDSNIKIRQ